MRYLTLAALSFCIGGGFSAQSHESLSTDVARSLGDQPVEYARHTREHRLAEIEWRMDRQDRRRGRYSDYGYGRRYGGPPPWAPAHGYRRHHRDWD